MLLLSSIGSLRRPRRCAPAAHRGAVVAICVLGGAMLFGLGGCATFGRRGPAAEKAAACRELSRQGNSALELGQWQRAEILLQQAIEASPDDPEARRSLAEALWHRGATTVAMSHLNAAIGARPDDATLAVRAGEMALALGDRDAALARAEDAIRLDPQLATAWALRGRVFWQLHQPDRALADLQRALEFAPGSADVLLDVAVIYRERGQPARCLTTLHHLDDVFPSGEEPQAALVLEGLTLAELGRPQQACEAFLAAAQRGPANAQVLYYLAQAQYSAGRYTEATSAAQQALALDASHQASRQLLAQLATHAAPAEVQRR